MALNRGFSKAPSFTSGCSLKNAPNLVLQILVYTSSKPVRASYLFETDSGNPYGPGDFFPVGVSVLGSSFEPGGVHSHGKPSFSRSDLTHSAPVRI